MTRSPEEQAQKERLESIYARSQSALMLTIERSVCGCDYGGNSWTTLAEARQIAVHLALHPGMRLLDLGAGAGWPGLYLSQTSGCEVVLVDLPLTGLCIATQRADNEGIANQVHTTVADAAALPFTAACFDAISHSDLLCCLRQKRSVLSACRSLIRRHGRMAFTVISVAPDLSAEEHNRAVANGPEFVESATDYRTLLADTGWKITAYEDVTTAYAASCRRQIDADEAHIDELAALLGTDECRERLTGWRSKLAALEDNLLRRELFVAIPCPEQVPAT